MKLYEKTLSSESIYDGKIIHVRLDQVELENGKTAMREVVDHPGGVSVAALTPENQLISVEMVYNHEIPDAKTQIGILKTAHLVEKGLL